MENTTVKESEVTPHWLTLDSAPRIDGEVYCVGDIHGEFDIVDEHIERFNLKDGHIIVLGDIGLGFMRKEDEDDDLEVLNEHSGREGMNIWFLKGNHDDPSYWTEKKEEFEKKYPHIHLLTQGPLWVNGELHYVLPGAVTVDRARRIMQEKKYGLKSHWEGNEIEFDEVLPRPRPVIKGVLAHTGHVPPACNSRLVDYYEETDPTLKADLKREQDIVEKAINTLRPDWWIYAHFHHAWSAVQATPKQRALNIGEIISLDYDRLEGKKL